MMLMGNTLLVCHDKYSSSEGENTPWLQWHYSQRKMDVVVLGRLHWPSMQNTNPEN